MSGFTSAMIMVLVMLIQAYLQLMPGVFVLFYHYALGKSSKKRANNLSVYFVMGMAVMVAVLMLAGCMIITDTMVARWVMIGVFLALAVSSYGFYFRKGPGTQLFVPRKIANNLIERTRNLDNRIDAFLLGVVACVLELIFTFPLYGMVALGMESLPSSLLKWGFLVLDFAVILSPVLMMKVLFDSGRNLAEIQRLRTKNKNFNRIIISVCYLALAIVITSLGGE